MKNLILVAISFLVMQNLFAQDKIYTKDKVLRTVNVLEQNDKFVIYKLLEEENSPVFTLKLNQIDSIVYANGLLELAGNQNPRHAKPFGVHFGIINVFGDNGYFILGFNYFILPQIDLRVNIGNSYGENYFSFGSNFHVNSNYSENRFTPYTGIYFGTDDNASFLQVPIGIAYTGKKGFSASLSLNKLLYLHYPINEILLEAKIGWRFKL